MHNNIYNIIRRNIKKYRNVQGLTQAQLAEKSGLSHDYIRQIESEKVGKGFSIEALYNISVALNISIEKLFEKEEK